MHLGGKSCCQLHGPVARSDHTALGKFYTCREQKMLIRLVQLSSSPIDNKMIISYIVSKTREDGRQVTISDVPR